MVKPLDKKGSTMIRVREGQYGVESNSQFGLRTVCGPSFSCGQSAKGTKWMVVVQCRCGAIAVVRTVALAGGHCEKCKSCRTHGDRKRAPGNPYSLLYSAWAGLRNRCLNPKNKDYAEYGGRGIAVCEAWDSYENFKAWSIENGWEPGRTIDRINNDKGYCPENCRWVTYKSQMRNRRNGRMITAHGITASLVEWSEKTGLDEATITGRLSRGWTAEDAVTMPAGKQQCQKQIDRQ